MKVSKEEILVIAKANGLSEEEAEKLIVLLGKNIGGTVIDIIKLVASKNNFAWDEMVIAAGEPTVRRMLNDLTVDL